MKKKHIILLILGALFLLSVSFHNNLWFDEAYTVALVQHNLFDMVKISIGDVHPPLYYVLLKLFTLVFSNSIIALRIFSALGMITLSVIGYTHIRKIFNEKIGIIFSFLTIFTPIILSYSNEIRMYSWVAVFVLMSGIYAYLISLKQSKKNLILFLIFSLLAAYTHHYGLISIVVINVILMMDILKNKKEIKKWLIMAISEVILFIPGIIIFLSQATNVAKEFWIRVAYPDVFFDILKFNLIGSIENKIIDIFVIIFAVLTLVYLIIKLKQNYQNRNPFFLGLIVYITVICISLLLSIISGVFIARYTLPMFGLLTLFISYILSLEKKKYIRVIVVMILLSLSFINAFNLYKNNYNEKNQDLELFFEQEIMIEDVFVYKNIGIGAIVAVTCPNNTQYFYNMENWNIDEAYKAFGPQMTTIESLEEINYDTIWVVEEQAGILLDIYLEEGYIIEEQHTIHQPYQDVYFVFTKLTK